MRWLGFPGWTAPGLWFAVVPRFLQFLAEVAEDAAHEIEGDDDENRDQETESHVSVPGETFLTLL